MHSELEDVFPFLAVIHTENMKGQIVHIMLRDEEYMGQKGAQDWGFYICLVQKGVDVKRLLQYLLNLSNMPTQVYSTGQKFTTYMKGFVLVKSPWMI